MSRICSILRGTSAVLGSGWLPAVLASCLRRQRQCGEHGATGSGDTEGGNCHTKDFGRCESPLASRMSYDEKHDNRAEIDRTEGDRFILEGDCGITASSSQIPSPFESSWPFFVFFERRHESALSGRMMSKPGTTPWWFVKWKSRQNAKDRIVKSTTKAADKVITFRKYDVPFPCAAMKRVANDV